jgi:DNA replication and repair protein RecF
MLLTQLRLSNFRTYKSLTLDIPTHLSCFVGSNAVGKTNILESIMAIATGNSFRAGVDREMMSWETDICRITAVTLEDTLELMITHGVVNGQKAPLKRFLVNGVPRRHTDFVGKLPAVLFAPEHLSLVTGSPSTRRRFWDDILSQTDREYRRALLSYEKGLRQRNKVLEQIQEGKASRSHLLFWDQLLIKEGGVITEARTQLVRALNSYQIQGVMHTITYDESVISASRIALYADAEVAAKATLVGPHRDDFSVSITEEDTKTNIEIKTYGSRGQQRLAVLWLKLAELQYMEHALGNRPILLLDDIFSELDREHDAIVAKLATQYQTLITSAEEETVSFLSRIDPNMTVFRLPFSS